MPFTVEQFFDVFEAYNLAHPYAWAVLSLFAIAAALSATGKIAGSHSLIFLVMAMLYAWCGVVYHIGFFSAVNPAARAFGVAFIVQAVLLAWTAFRPKAFYLEQRAIGMKAAAFILVAYSLFLYPLITETSGHVYPRRPTFGAPCPITIFTLAMLSLRRYPLVLAAVPLAWAVIGSSAAVYFEVYADLGLLVAAMVFIFSRIRHSAADSKTDFHRNFSTRPT